MIQLLTSLNHSFPTSMQGLALKAGEKKNRIVFDKIIESVHDSEPLTGNEIRINN